MRRAFTKRKSQDQPSSSQNPPQEPIPRPTLTALTINDTAIQGELRDVSASKSRSAMSPIEQRRNLSPLSPFPYTSFESSTEPRSPSDRTFATVFPFDLARPIDSHLRLPDSTNRRASGVPTLPAQGFSTRPDGRSPREIGPGPSRKLGGPPDRTHIMRFYEPCLYTFTQHSSNSLLLWPPSDEDAVPAYLISLKMNYFAPASWITTVYKGNSEDGELVGEFEAGTLGCTKTSTVSIRGTEYLMKDIIEFSTLMSGFTWKLPGNLLFWDNSGGTRSCFEFTQNSKKGDLLARFAPAVGLRQAGQLPPLTTLTLYPPGQNRLDDILLSALILERRR